jgi:hypothetical protein
MRRKFGNRKTEIGGIVFDSALEARKWQELCTLQKIGAISDLQRQVKFDLSVNDVKVCGYIADFVYTENGQTVVFDAKGMILPEFKIKAKLFKAIHGFDITLSDGLPATARRTKAAKAKAALPKVSLTRSR